MTSNTTVAQLAPAWFSKEQQLISWLTVNLGGGPRPIKIAWAVQTKKVLTGVIRKGAAC